MYISKVSSENINTLITCAAISGVGAFAGKMLKRPPIFAGIFSGFAYLFKKAIMDHSNIFSLSETNQKLLENMVDVTLPYAYYQALDISPKFFERYDIDFCLPGIFTAYFITQKLGKIIEQILRPNKDIDVKSKQPTSLKEDMLYITTAAISGAIIGGKSIERKKAYINIMLALAVLERISTRLISTLKPSEQLKKTLKNLLYLCIPLASLCGAKISASRVEINRFKFIKACFITAIFYNAVNSAKAAGASVSEVSRIRMPCVS